MRVDLYWPGKSDVTLMIRWIYKRPNDTLAPRERENVAFAPMERGVGTHARPEGPAVRVPTYIFF
jgi:hypothetical protein